jgi:hypothetical protein
VADVEPPPQQARRGDGAFLAVAALLIVGFVVAFGARPATVISTALLDDGLFMQLGRSLAAGQWLGAYDERTLAKGMGFPLFLAAANVTGLAYPLAIAGLYAASAAFAAAVVRRLTASRVAALGLLAALLLTPALYDGELMRVSRELFYAAATVAFVAAGIALATGCLGRRRGLGVLTGLLGALVWLTREEGIWLAPFIAVLAIAPVLATAGPWRGRLRAVAPAGQALGAGVAAVVAVGLVNWAVYGRFEVNEVKAAPFQGAVRALQEASAAHHRAGVPVPAAARAEIYAVSPAFASLREPLLDGPLQAEATTWGCRQRREMCGDFGGGWFIWNLRASAAIHGRHASPDTAAAFYRVLAQEVRRGCVDGRLKCRAWPVPLVPPMAPGEDGRVASSFGKVLDVLTFGRAVSTAVAPSDLSAGDAEAQLAFLNRPAIVHASVRRRLDGWFRGRGAEWFTLQAGPTVEVAAFARNDSPDLVGAFGDPALARQRFAIEVVCPEAACPVVVRTEGGAAQPMDLAKLGAGTHPIGAATLHVDRASGGDGLIKARFSSAWVEAASRLSPLFRALLLVGGAAYVVLAARAALRRRLSTGLVVCTALLGAALARALILALIDALSFDAATVTYVLPAIPLLLIGAVIALHEAATGLAGSASFSTSA